MIKSDFASVFRAEAITAFQRQFHFGVEPLDNPAGITPFGLKIVEQKSAVRLERSSNFFQGSKLGSGNFGTPSIQKLSSPSRGNVGPEMLECFYEQESAQSAEGGTFDLTHAPSLARGPVAAFFQECPPHFFEQRVQPGIGAGAGFLAPDFVDGLVEFFDDMEAVENLQSLGEMPGGGIEVGLPHVRADEADALAELGAKNLEEELEGLLGAVGADPQEALAVVVDLVDQRPKLILLSDMDLIYPKGLDAGEVAVLDAVFDDGLHRSINVGPAHAKGSCHLGPRQEARPLGQEESENIADLEFAGGPRQPFDSRPAFTAVDAPGRINQKDEQSPEGNEVPLAFGQPVISRPLLAATRTYATTAVACSNLHTQCFGHDRVPIDGLIDKALDRVNLSEYRFQRYVAHNGWFIGALPGSASLTFFCLPQASLTHPSPRTPAAASGAGFGGAQPPSNWCFFTHRFL